MSENKHYDIFISYRRTNEDGTKNSSTARTIMLQIESLGYKDRVFFDFHALADGEFEKQIMPAIANAKIFVLVLTPNALDRCINEDDWVRREIEQAQKHNVKIIPINIDEKFQGVPQYLPESIRKLQNTQFTTIHTDASFPTDMKSMVDKRITPEFDNIEYISELQQGDTFLKITTDIDCRVFVDDEEKMIATAGKVNRLPLRGGSYMLKFVSTACNADVFKPKDLFRIQPHTEELYPVELIPIRDARIAEERRIQEEERKKREEEERKRREAEEAERRAKEAERKRKEAEEAERRAKEEAERKKQEEWDQYRLNLPDDKIKLFRKERKRGYIDIAGKEIIPCIYDDAWSFSKGLAKVMKNGKWGYIDKTGKEIIPCIYDSTYKFSEGLAEVKKNGKWGYIDKTGKEVIPCIYDEADNFSEGLAGVIKNGKWGYIDKTGKEIIPCIYDNAGYFSEGLAKVMKNRKWGYIDIAGKEIIPCIYDDAWSFSKGLAMVMKNGKWGYIDKTGNEVIPCIYESAEKFCDGKAKVTKKFLGFTRTFYIDKNGKKVEE